MSISNDKPLRQKTIKPDNPKWIPGDVWTIEGEGKNVIVQIVKDCRYWRGNMEFCVAVWNGHCDDPIKSLSEWPKTLIFLPIKKLSVRDRRYKYLGNSMLNDQLSRLSVKFKARLAHAPLIDARDNGGFLWDGVSDPVRVFGMSHNEFMRYPAASLVITEGLFGITT